MSKAGIYKIEYMGVEGIGFGGLTLIDGIASGCVIGARIGGTYREFADGIEFDYALSAATDFASVAGVETERGTRSQHKVFLNDAQLNGEVWSDTPFEGATWVKLTKLISF